MKIQYVSSYPTHYNSKKNINKKNVQSENIQNSTKHLSSVYIPFFGAKKNSSNNSHNVVINGILNNKEYPDYLKQYLNKLLKIKDFETAAMAVNMQEMLALIHTGYSLSPVFEEVLKGQYVTIFPNSNVEKPLIDLKAIAEYNKKHIEKPLNLYESINENSLAGIFCYRMQQEGISQLSEPTEISYRLNDETIETTIKYKPAPKISFAEALKELSEKEINNLKNADFSPEMREFLQSKHMNKDLQKLLWEMSEIPFFTAAIQNASMEDLVDILEDIDLLKPVSTEALKGNITIKNTSTQKEKPIINLAKLAIYNYLNPENQKYLFDELCANKLYSNLINITTEIYNTTGKIPSHFISVDKDGSELRWLRLKNGNGKNINVTAELLQNAIQQGALKHHIPYVILFENDLNQFIENKTPQKVQVKNKNKNLNNLKKFAPMPESVKRFLNSPKENNEYKKIIYELGNTPYFYAAIRNVPESTIRNIVYLKSEYSDTFDKLISGKIKILELDEKKQKKTIINLKKLASLENPPENLLHISSLAAAICEDMGKIKNTYKDNLLALNYCIYKDEDAECFFMLKDKTLKSINLPVSDTIKKYLLSLPMRSFFVITSE